jgi:hypothetical protein
MPVAACCDATLTENVAHAAAVMTHRILRITPPVRGPS